VPDAWGRNGLNGKGRSACLQDNDQRQEDREKKIEFEGFTEHRLRLLNIDILVGIAMSMNSVATQHINMERNRWLLPIETKMTMHTAPAH